MRVQPVMSAACFALPAALLLFLGGCGGDSSASKQQEQPIQKAELPEADAISTFMLVGHTETGRKKWQIEGETADLLNDRVDLSPVTATSFGEIEVHLTSEKGRFHKTTEDVHLEGNVVVTTSDEGKLTTETLDWTAKEETATTADWVTVTRPGITVVGLGGIGFPNLKKVRLDKQVTVTLAGEGGQTVVTCDGPMEVDYGKHLARFWENVRVEDAKGVVESDRLDVNLDQLTNQIEKATFWGNVKIQQEGQVAYAKRANYWQAEGRMRLSGNPKIVMAPSEEFE
jgi:LPS export ABC transporter protein LptC